MYVCMYFSAWASFRLIFSYEKAQEVLERLSLLNVSCFPLLSSTESILLHQNNESSLLPENSEISELPLQ